MSYVWPAGASRFAPRVAGRTARSTLYNVVQIELAERLENLAVAADRRWLVGSVEVWTTSSGTTFMRGRGSKTPRGLTRVPPKGGPPSREKHAFLSRWSGKIPSCG